jgi:spoIIIJ-associated protein
VASPKKPVEKETEKKPVEKVAQAEKPEVKELTTKQLQEHGNIAADYIEGILDIANLEGDIEIEIKDQRVTVSVIADNLVTKQALRKLAQKEVVMSLQNLSRMVIYNKTGQHSKLVVDVAGYREQQKGGIEKLAQKMIEKAQETKEPVHLRSMNSFERRIAHQIVSDAGLFSHSEGTGRDRHLIITLQEEVANQENDA